MKKLIQNIIQIHLILMSVSFFSLTTNLVQANSYTESDYLIKTGNHQNHENQYKPRKSFVCNGNIVEAAEAIKRHLSCIENDPLAAQWVQLLNNPSAD